MKITYTAPNRSHHYPYAAALQRAGHLHAFVSGFTRLSPRSPLPAVGDKLKRHDFIQTMFLASLKINYPAAAGVQAFFNRLSNRRLDAASYKWAKESDAFIFYRTEGFRTTQRLKKKGASTLCIMEEVNSHVESANEILYNEFKSLGYTSKYQKEIDYDLRMKTYEQADCILCPSEFVRNSFLAKGFSNDQLLKVNFGFPPVETSAAEIDKSKTNTFKLLYVGQLNYRKGLRFAIEAFKKLRHPKKEFVIVGPRTSFTGLETTQIPDGVIFTGILKGEELNNQYKSASVFVLPSLEEGLALVQGEALSFGLPLLITTNTGGDDIIKNGVEGFIVPPFNAEILAEKLQQMADDKILLGQMSVNALNTAKALGSWDRAEERLIAEINRVRHLRNK